MIYEDYSNYVDQEVKTMSLIDFVDDFEYGNGVYDVPTISDRAFWDVEEVNDESDLADLDLLDEPNDEYHEEIPF